MTGLVLTTRRTQIRQINSRDFDEMMAVYGDLELMRFVGDSTAISPHDARRWIDITLNNYKVRGYGLFIIENPTADQCLGFIGLTHPGNQTLPEIKYVLKKPFWGTGLATEVVSALTTHAHGHWNLPEIIATVHPDNHPSFRVLQKAGFTRQPDRIEEDSEPTAIFCSFQTK